MCIRTTRQTAFLALVLLLTASCDAPESGNADGVESESASATATDPAQNQGDNAEAQKPKQLQSTDDFQTGISGFDRDAHPGKILYEQNCGACHNGAVPKAPHFNWLELVSASTLLKSLDAGVMRQQSAHLTPDERLQIVEYITRQHIKSRQAATPPQATVCEGAAAQFDLAAPPPAVNWGHDTARFSPADVAKLSISDIPKLELKWAFAFPDALRARSQPAIAMGAAYVGSPGGEVYALDLETGCARWTFNASGEVRTAIVVSTVEGDRVDPADPPLAFFGDILANFYSVNALTGELVWSLRVDDHPSATLTGSPAYHDGKLYIPVSSLEIVTAADPAYECCTFRGKVMAVRAATGDILWEHFSIPELPMETGVTSAGTRILSPSGAPIWSSPAIDVKRNRLYVGTGENYATPADGNSDAILAVDITTGQRVWTLQKTAGDAWNVACMMADNPNCPPEDGPDFDLGSSMILADLPDGSDILLVGHKNGTVFGLDPDANGALLWSAKVGRGSIQGGVHFGMAAESQTLYAPINDMNDVNNGKFLDPTTARPGMSAINISNGAVLWSHLQKNICPDGLAYCDPGISAPVTASPGAVFAGHLDGFIRAYDGATGEVIWEYDTKPEITGVNGVPGHGGGMSGAGPAVADGYVIVNSGYGLYSHAPGNLLLAFAPPSPEN
jgi:polyvinyl alcohol dehydrogenase (cytochrome)